MNTREASVNISTFAQSNTIVEVDATHNLYYQIFGEKKTKWIFKNIVQSKIYAFVCLFGALITLIATCYVLAIESYKLFEIFCIFCTLSFIFWNLSYILSLNYDIIKLALHTFDFWYKMSNMVCPIIFLIISFDNSNFSSFLIFTCVLSLLTTCYLIFMIDAAFWPYKLKLYVSITTAKVALLLALFVFFIMDDIEFAIFGNVFKSGKITLSLKSLAFSGYTSVAFFTLKPSYAIWKAIRKQNKYDTQKLNIYQSSSINNKPYFKWTNTQILSK